MLLTSDFRIHRTNVNGDNYCQNVDNMIDEMRNLNVTFIRMTEFPSEKTLFLEGWKNRPEDQGPEPEWQDVIGFGR